LFSRERINPLAAVPGQIFFLNDKFFSDIFRELADRKLAERPPSYGPV